MKALCIKQPFASMIANGEKTIELRTWRTNYRGELLIVASKFPKREGLPSGKGICIVELKDCRKMHKSDVKLSCCDYDSAYYSWMFEEIRILETPINVKGRLGIFDINLI